MDGALRCLEQPSRVVSVGFGHNSCAGGASHQLWGIAAQKGVDMREDIAVSHHVACSRPDSVSQYHAADRPARNEGRLAWQLALPYSALDRQYSRRLIEGDDGAGAVAPRGEMDVAANRKLRLLFGVVIA